jgi:3-dehydroquinate synthase
MDKIDVLLGDRTYPIFIGKDFFESLPDHLNRIKFPKRLALVTNTMVEGLYAKTILQILQAKNFSVLEIVLPDGEEHKNLKVLESIYDELIINNFDRGCGLLALGGGVVGDMAGFAAATFLRGIPYVQVPTTLLAQVDSSVGGKTAVNHSLGKNLIGAFYQPEMVLIDVEVLNTLEPREVSAGLAEVVKYGVIRDAEFFCWLENNVQRLKERDPETLIHAIKRSCQIKADIVAVDEKEGSIRAFLNYGHTFGHAIENLSGYGQWKHGEAVSVGMVIASKISAQKGLCSQHDVDRLTLLLKALDLPTKPPDFTLDEYVISMQRDKKVKQGQLTLVLNRGIGEVALHKVTDISSVFSSVL